jgi:hypothetical protein
VSNVVYAPQGDPNNQKGQFFNFSVPVPFGKLTELDPPLVNNDNPKAVKAGETFIINGVNFFPSLLESVLIGGNALDPANFMAINSQQIEAVAPDTPGQALPVVVKTTQGFSGADATITITG